jgi:hypothetical protein
MKVATRAQPTFSIEDLTEEQVTILCALVGGIGCGSAPGPVGDLVRELYYALDARLSSRGVSFSNFFKVADGQVVCK